MLESYMPYLYDVKYGFGYDVKIHALQTSLSLLGYTNAYGVNKNDIQFGYYCVNTEAMLIAFQKDNKLSIGKIDKQTWLIIFNMLKDRCNCYINEIDTNKIIISGIDSFIDSSSNLSNQILGGETIFYSPRYPQNDRESYPVIDNESITDGGELFQDSILQIPSSGRVTSPSDLMYGDLSGAKKFDELVYNYIVSGGKVYNNLNLSYNISGGKSWNEEYLTPVEYRNYSGSANKDYDYIYSLLANSIYEGNFDSGPIDVSNSDASSVGVYTGNYDSSTNEPFFRPENIDELRRSRFDITIVYGAKGVKSRKILSVVPISVAQEVNASGEPVYDLYEFVAKDIIEGNN